MTTRKLLIAALALLWSCSHSKNDQPVQASASERAAEIARPAKPTSETAGHEPAQNESTMDSNVHSDPGLKPVEGADVSPLPGGALLRYQVIRLGVGCRGNYRFILYRDGRVFMQENGRRSSCEAPQRFDAPYPETPTATLSKEVVDAVVTMIRDREFFRLSTGYRPPQRRFDGAMQILEVALDDTSHRVVLEKVEHPVVSAIRDAVLTPLYNP